MLDGVEPEAAQAQLLDDPDGPGFDVGAHLLVREVDVGEHQKVCVALGVVYRLGPVLVVAAELVDGFLLVGGVVVRSAEVIPAVVNSLAKEALHGATKQQIKAEQSELRESSHFDTYQ